MSQPKRLIVTYDDGSTKEADFADLDGRLLLRLAQIGLCPPPGSVGAAKHYLLMRWRDGWQEVIGIDAESADLLRYYVIQRIEDRGRLSLDVGADYPELIVVERTPRDLVAATIVGGDGVKSYSLGSEVERWEGIFEAGGKKEFVKYDRTSPAYPRESSEDPEALAEVRDAILDEIEKKGLTPKALLSMQEPLRIAEYKELAGSAGIRGARRQQDVYGFIEMMLRGQGGIET